MSPQQEANLRELFSTHADALRQLLPASLMWPVEVRQYGPLTKYVLGEARPGVWAMLHHLTGSDSAAGPHDHPTRFDSHGLAGHYWERIYCPDGRREVVLRAAGGNHTIWPDTVHEVLAVSEGGAWTLVFGHEVVREARHYPELARP